LTNYLILSPYSGNNVWGESICSQQQKREAGKLAHKSASVVRLIESKNSSEVRNHNKILKKHVEQGAFTGFSPVLFSGVKPKYKSGKHVEFFHVHVTIGTADVIKFSTSPQFAAVANGGGGGACGKGFREENTTLMEEEMFVGDVISL